MIISTTLHGKYSYLHFIDGEIKEQKDSETCWRSQLVAKDEKVKGRHHTHTAQTHRKEQS